MAEMTSMFCYPSWILVFEVNYLDTAGILQDSIQSLFYRTIARHPPLLSRWPFRMM